MGVTPAPWLPEPSRRPSEAIANSTPEVRTRLLQGSDPAPSKSLRPPCSETPTGPPDGYVKPNHAEEKLCAFVSTPVRIGPVCL